MANDDIARGFVPLNRGAGRSPGRYYLCTTGTHLFLGQPVTLAADGRVTAASTGPTGTIVVLGVVGGFADASKASSSLPNNFPYLNTANWTGSEPFVYVYDDPMQEYYIQEATNGGTRIQLTDLGASISTRFKGSNPGLITGSSAGWATLELDAATLATTTANLCQLLGLHDQLNTDGTQSTTGNFAKWVVRFLQPQRAGATANPQN